MRKKLLSLALALVMCLGLTVPALAADYTEVIPCKYARVGDFSEGLASVAIQIGTQKNGTAIVRWGFIDKTGKEVIPCQYDYYDNTNRGYRVGPSFSEGLVAVLDENNKWGFIDKTGKVVIPFQYTLARNFSEGLAAVYLNGKCGFIDKTGKVVIPFQYTSAGNFSEGLAAVYLNSECGFIDKTGKVAIPFQYTSAGNFSEGLAAVEDTNGQWGYIDKTGKEVIPREYAYVGDFSEGLVWVQDENYKQDFIDQTGKVAIPYQYKSLGNFSEGLAMVGGEHNKQGFIDKTGKVVIPFQYNSVNSSVNGFSEGVAVVNLAGKYGYIDKTGKEVVPCQYAWARPFSEGMAAVAVEDGGHGVNYLKWGFICLGDVPVVEPEKPAEPEQPTVAADSDLVIVDGVLTKYVGPGGNVILPSSVTSIGNGAFNLCWKLTDVTIPDSVTSIGDQAFSKCGGLKSVIIPNSVTSIGVEAFSGCSVLTSVTIPDSVTSIGRYAFGGCEGLKNVTIGSGVTSIGDYAFNKCESLTSVTIPDSVTSIGEYAFYGCKGLTSVTIGSSVTSTGRGMFSGCSGLKSVVIPTNVTSIEGTAFNWCRGLTSVTISSSVTSVGEMAFNFCDNLKDVYYGGTEDQWKAIQIEDFNSSLTGATIHYNRAMPEQDTPATVGNFTDVKTGDWFAEPVKWAVEKNITAGTSATTFSPNTDCSVAQILTFLWRANGSPKPTTANPFSDVKSGDYYADAAAWAYEKGMVSGTTFGGNTPCTRSMAVTYMWKAAGSPSAEAASFTDVPANADYAQAVAWAVEQGVTAGTSATTFSPDSICTRGQIVTFLYRGLAK